MAYRAGFGSIEADIFLVDSVLYVAHDTIELRKKIKLDDEYLKPLLECLRKNNNGAPYADNQKKLQMLIDIKSDSILTLQAFIRLLRKNPELVQSGLLSWVITGNRPDASLFTSYPSFILFDAEAHRQYSPAALSKVVMMSDDFKNFSHWDGKNQILPADSLKLTELVHKAHELKKAVRFGMPLISPMHGIHLCGYRLTISIRIILRNYPLSLVNNFLTL